MLSGLFDFIDTINVKSARVTSSKLADGQPRDPSAVGEPKLEGDMETNGENDSRFEDRLNALAKELDIPPDLIPLLVTGNQPGDLRGARNPDGRIINQTSFKDYTVEIVGIQVDVLPNGPWPIMWEAIGPFVTHIWRKRVLCAGTKAFLEALWHPERGYSLTLRGLELVETKRQAVEGALLLKAAPLLNLSVQPRGCPPGSREWTQEQREQIERRLTTAADALRNSKPPRKRTRENMSEMAVIEIKTLDAWLKKLKRRLDSF